MNANTETFAEDAYDLEYAKVRYKRQKIKNQRIRLVKNRITVYTALSAVLFISLIAVAVRVSVYYAELRKSSAIAEKTREIASVYTVAPVQTRPEPTAAAAPEKAAETGIAEVAPEISEAAIQPVAKKIAKLREAFSNGDIVAYIKIDNTDIDYAVVKSSDNEFYLNRDLNRETNSAGSIFMDYENNPHDLLNDRNIVIYGHNMRDGSMFHNLRYYADKQYYEEHRYITLTTLYEETLWEIFAAYITDIGFGYTRVFFNGDNDFMSLMDKIYEKSLYQTGIQLTPADTVLTLSTCTNTAPEKRIAVSARLVDK